MSTAKDERQTSKAIASFGSWHSELSSDVIVSTTIGFGTIAVDADTPYWIETRPTENGRHVIVRRKPDRTIEEAIPREFYARTKVHEYGGAAFTARDGIVYFTEFTDQQLYKLLPGKYPEKITNRPGLRFADPVIDVRRDRVIAICEDHTKGAGAVTNKIVSISLQDPQDFEVILEGNDFYCSPKLSNDGKQLAWITWNHPDMPWDNTELWTGGLNDAHKITNKQHIAGGDNESVLMPKWSPTDVLHFVSDRSGWWNIYRWQNNEVSALLTMSAEFARAQWHLGYSQYDFLRGDKIACSYNIEGSWHLVIIDTDGKNFREIETPFSDIWWLNALGDDLIFRGGASSIPQAIVRLKVNDGQAEIIKTSTTFEANQNFSKPQVVNFSLSNRSVFGFYYHPLNPRFQGPQNELPPLLVLCHGGPTNMASTLFDLEKQFWTSRGFALFDINYSGSAGYGREYRNRLRNNWGIIDFEDCVEGALHLVEKNLVDKNRLFIKGGSAGGFTALCALANSTVFRAGASYYGICDLGLMRKETHKFESRYLDRLVGTFPEEEQIYKERSPISHVEKLQKPIIFFQGLEDMIVPPNQSEKMAKALRSRNIPVAYLAFAGEQHAFRKAETLKQCLDAEYAFYARVAGFQETAIITPLKIENLKD